MKKTNKETLDTTIEKILKAHDNNAAECLQQIKAAIANHRKPDFSVIKDGDHFMYKGIEFIRLGKEQGGILCIKASVWRETAFDKNNRNNYANASVCKDLETEFLPLLDESDLLPFTMDLTADNGDDAYGTYTSKVGILSCDLYRKYRKIVPLFPEWMWTCTPWYCSGNAYSVRFVSTSGDLYDSGAYGAHGVVPACIFIDNQ